MALRTNSSFCFYIINILVLITIVFTARYALSPYITQIHFVLKGLNVGRQNYELVNSFVYLRSKITISSQKSYLIMHTIHLQQ